MEWYHIGLLFFGVVCIVAAKSGKADDYPNVTEEIWKRIDKE